MIAGETDDDVSVCLMGVDAADDVWVVFRGVDGGLVVSFFSTMMVLCSTDDENCGSLLVLVNGSGASLEKCENVKHYVCSHGHS